jgi:4-diphosphocytidyl-2-C-methyl-D-erythritol kinase
MLRTATVPAFAKLNLSLLVLGKRPDGFHELRTIFQTIALHDTLKIQYEPTGPLRISLDDPLNLPDNLILRAARAYAEAVNLRGRIRLSIAKRIPMGGGLGGGSSDAAATLLALPVLTGRPLPLSTLSALAINAGSDVPFLLHGGTALALGRGEELYPLPTPQAPHVLVLSPGIHVSTPEAYRALERPALTELTFDERIPRLETFRACVEAVSAARPARIWQALCGNDFEEAVFHRHPKLDSIRRSLEKHGAGLARLSGSGSTVFGVFPSPVARDRARAALPEVAATPTRFLSRAGFRAAWLRALRDHREGTAWPPPSRYASKGYTPRS